MAYTKHKIEWSNRDKCTVIRLEARNDRLFPPRIRETVPYTGQSEAEITVLKANLFEKLKKEVEANKIKSQTFGEFGRLYRQNSGKHAQSSIVSDLIRVLDISPHIKWEDDFDVFIKKQATRHLMRYKKTDHDGIKLIETSKPLSISTIKSYKRYFKAICSYACSEKVPKKMRLEKKYGVSIIVGKSERSTGYVTQTMRDCVNEEIDWSYNWFKPHLLFACSMPVRPEDQFGWSIEDAEEECVIPEHVQKDLGLTIDKIDELHGQIVYIPKKTWKSGRYATPQFDVVESIRKYVLQRKYCTKSNLIFPRPGIETLRENMQELYPITRSYLNNLWKRIKTRTRIKIKYYDYTRHEAVNWLLSLKIPESMIRAYAGWSTNDMILQYDNNNRARLSVASKAYFSAAPNSLKQEII